MGDFFITQTAYGYVSGLPALEFGKVALWHDKHEAKTQGLCEEKFHVYFSKLIYTTFKNYFQNSSILKKLFPKGPKAAFKIPTNCIQLKCEHSEHDKYVHKKKNKEESETSYHDA